MIMHVGDTIFEIQKNFFFLCYIYMEDNQGKFQDGKKKKYYI